jgi:hypothetical protein
MNNIHKSQEISALERELVARAAVVDCAMVQMSRLTLPAGLFDPAAASAPLPDASQLLPLLVAENDGGSFSIVDGCKRYLALRGLGRAFCACGIAAGPLTASQAGLLRILVNRSRGAHIGERFVFYKWMAGQGYAKDQTAVAQLLGIRWNEAAELADLSECPGDVVAAVCSDRIHVQNAADFRALSEKDRSSFAGFFGSLRLSQQAEREFLQWLAEIASSRDCGAGDILALPECAAVKNDVSLNDPQRIEKLRSILHSLRHPRFDAALQAWNELSRKANPHPSSIHFLPDPFFEKDRIEVRVVVSNPDKAAEMFRDLSAVSVEAWQGLIQPADGTVM